MEKKYKQIQFRHRNLKEIVNSFFIFLLVTFLNPIYGQQAVTVSTAGVSGRLASAQIQINRAYAPTDLNSSVGIITSEIQTWAIPLTGLHGITVINASNRWNSAALPVKVVK